MNIIYHYEQANAYWKDLPTNVQNILFYTPLFVGFIFGLLYGFVFWGLF